MDKIKKKLGGLGGGFKVSEQKIIVPTFGKLLQFKVKYRGRVIEVDVGQHKVLELYNSKLLRAYCLFDKRFRHLAIVLKAWNKTLPGDSK